MAIIWIWDTITGYTTFERTHKYDLLSYVLLAMPFIYPLVSLARGLSFPEMTSPVMPCSVVVFTIGLLLLFAQKVNMFLVLFLCHWSLIGLSKTYFFQIPEDFLLASATIPGLYLFFREYFLNNLHADEKERAEHVMLVDLARNDMGRISEFGTVKVTDFMSVKNYSHVMHIVSMVEGRKKGSFHPFDLLASFLPAGTLSGAPKIRAMEIIEELESVRRGLYGGATGYVDFSGDMDLYSPDINP